MSYFLKFYEFLQAAEKYCLRFYLSTLKPLVIAQKKSVRVMLIKGGRELSFPLFLKLQVLLLRYLFVYKVLEFSI